MIEFLTHNSQLLSYWLMAVSFIGILVSELKAYNILLDEYIELQCKYIAKMNNQLNLIGELKDFVS